MVYRVIHVSSKHIRAGKPWIVMTICALAMLGAIGVANAEESNAKASPNVHDLAIRASAGSMMRVALGVESAGNVAEAERTEDDPGQAAYSALLGEPRWAQIGLVGSIEGGDMIKPYLRLGLGLHLASVDVSLAGLDTAAPDSAFAMFAAANIRGGINLELGHRATLEFYMGGSHSVRLRPHTPQVEDDASFRMGDLGARFSYRW